MQGGKPSKLNKDIGNIRLQLKSGRTRGQNPRDLTPEENTALEQKRNALLAQMRDSAKERAVSRISAHTTLEADRVIESQRATNDRVEAMSAVIVDGKIPTRSANQAPEERLGQIRQVHKFASTLKLKSCTKR